MPVESPTRTSNHLQELTVCGKKYWELEETVKRIEEGTEKAGPSTCPHCGYILHWPEPLPKAPKGGSVAHRCGHCKETIWVGVNLANRSPNQDNTSGSSN